MFQPPLPFSIDNGMFKRYQSDAHSLTEGKSEPECPLILNRLSTELVQLPTPRHVRWVTGSRPCEGLVFHGKERGQRDGWAFSRRKRPEINRKEQRQPDAKFFKDNNAVEIDNSKPLLCPRGQGVEKGPQMGARPFLPPRARVQIDLKL